jgi:hypothetical protein
MPDPTPTAYTLRGTLAFVESEAFARFDDDVGLDRSGDHCVSQTTHGYTDSEPGMQVVVKNESDRILGPGVTVGCEVVGGIYDSEQDACVWTFTVEGIGEAEFSTVEAGPSRGPTYPLAEMEAQELDGRANDRSVTYAERDGIWHVSRDGVTLCGVQAGQSVELDAKPRPLRWRCRGAR